MKTKQLKSTGILVVILVILAGAAWWLMSTQETAVSKKTVFKLPEKEISGFTLEKTDADGKQTKVVVERDGEKAWKIVAPIQDPAYATTVENLTQAVAKIEAEVAVSAIDSGAKDSSEVGNLADYGLAPAAISVQVDFKGKKPSKKVLIGAQTPVGYKFFAKFEDDPRILLVDSIFKGNLDQDLNAFRDKELLRTPKEQIKTVRLWSELDKIWYQLERQQDGWRMTEPYQEKGSEDFDTVLTSLTGSLINEFLEDTPNLVQYGLNQPAQQVELTLDNGQKVSIKAALKDEKWYVISTGRQGIFQFNNSSAMDFLKLGLKDLIAKKLTNDSEKDIQSLTVQVGAVAAKKLSGKEFTEIRKQLLLSKTVQPYFQESIPMARVQFDGQQPLYTLTINRKSGSVVELKFYLKPEKSEITTYLVTDSERPLVLELMDTENERTLLDKIKNVK
jgi:hypothetical protein